MGALGKAFGLLLVISVGAYVYLQYTGSAGVVSVTKQAAAKATGKKGGEAEVAPLGIKWDSSHESVKKAKGEPTLLYRVLKSGPTSGPQPKATDEVSCHYKGILAPKSSKSKDKETEFDSSYKRGQPLSFRLTGVIKGWTKILQEMHVGDKWEVYIPSNLAYGASGAGGICCPVVSYDVEC